MYIRHDHSIMHIHYAHICHRIITWSNILYITHGYIVVIWGYKMYMNNYKYLSSIQGSVKNTKEKQIMNFNRNEIEKTDRKVLMTELKNIASLGFTGVIAKQNAEKIVMWMRLRDGKITQVQYDSYWASFTEM